MANDNFDWESLVNFDSFESSPFAGCDMQGGEAGEDGTAAAQLEMERQSANQDYQSQPSCVDPFWPRDFAHAAVGIDHGDNTEWSSTGMRNSLEWSSQQNFDQHGSPEAAKFAQYHDDGSSDPDIGSLGAAHGFHPLNHNYAAENIGEHNDGDLHEGILTQPGLVTSSTTSLINNAFVGVLSENIHQQPCLCISCIEIGWFSHPMHNTYHKDMTYDEKFYHCRFPGCQEKEIYTWITEHERSHFLEEGRYMCKEAHCNFTTKRWSDLKRHAGSKHCTSPTKKFPCPVLWCNKSGNNGFARKDKLNSHYKTIHGGKSMPGKANQAIKPKVTEGA